MEVMSIVQKLRTISIFEKRRKDRINIFISLSARKEGGGSNTFAYNFIRWISINKAKYNLVYNISRADKAIIIADKMDIWSLEKAKDQGCFIIHRLDEHVEPDEGEYRRKKHAHIKEPNRFADVTVFQSNFVFENMHPFLGCPQRYEVIHNGANPEEFYPAEKSGEFIGHITWGTGDKKRLDMLYETIRENPDEHFLLVGNHSMSNYDFTGLSNVRYTGIAERQKINSLLHRMKFLFYPSENDPCPNTVIEAILAGIPVCYNPIGGSRELVKDCGLPVSEFKTMLKDYLLFRQRCLLRNDLNFDSVARKYMELK